jgi:hypothetical protein
LALSADCGGPPFERERVLSRRGRPPGTRPASRFQLALGCAPRPCD